MQTKWLIQDQLHNEFVVPKLIEALTKRSIEYTFVPYLPFGIGDYSEYYPDDQFVLCLGSLSFIKRIQRERPEWYPNSWCNFKTLQCNAFYAHLGKYLLNEDYIFIPVGELLRRKEFLYTNYGIEDFIFMRPNTGDKSFTGGVVAIEDFKHHCGFINDFCSPEDYVIIASPKPIQAEWRFFVGDSQIVTGSQYRYNGVLDSRSDVEEGALVLAQQIANAGYHPNPMYSLDICRSNDQYYLMELGAFSCSGFYACDLDKIVEAADNILALLVFEELQNNADVVL